jgi:hypothetical protein
VLGLFAFSHADGIDLEEDGEILLQEDHFPPIFSRDVWKALNLNLSTIFKIKF